MKGINEPVVIRPYLTTVLAVVFVALLVAVLVHFSLWESLAIPAVVAVLAIGDYFTRQVRIENGRLSFEVKGAVTSSLSIDMARITTLRFRALSVEIHDDHGTIVVMDIGWYSGGQMDRILAHVQGYSRSGAVPT